MNVIYFILSLSLLCTSQIDNVFAMDISLKNDPWKIERELNKINSINKSLIQIVCYQANSLTKLKSELFLYCKNISNQILVSGDYFHFLSIEARSPPLMTL